MPRSVLALVCFALMTGACGPRVERQLVFEDQGVRVELRSLAGVARGLAHPAVISDVRLAHILAQLAYTRPDGEPGAMVRPEHVYPLAAGLRDAFAAAGPDDEVIASAFATERRLGIFTHNRVTALRGFFEGDHLMLEFYAVDEELRDVERHRGREYQVPLDLPSGRLRVLPGQALEARGARGVRVDWRDPHFRSPVPVGARPGERRRTVLMEAEGAPLEPLPDFDAGRVPPEQRDAQLRALDQLDAARRAGQITEAEFRRRRRLVLDGRLEEAGYPKSAQ